MGKQQPDAQKQREVALSGEKTGSEQTPPYAIGGVIRERRKEIRSTLEEVASKAGIGTGFLSDIERNKASPSVATLFKICEVLDISIGSLFQSEQSVLVQADRRERMSYGGQNILFELLNSRNSRSISAVIGELAPNACSGDEMHVLQSEEQFIFVVKGEMVWEFQDKTYHLREGDALTIDPKRKHRYFNPSAEQVCQAICIISPPPK